MINGADEISLKAFELLKQGYSVKDISSTLNITLDQSKKLSQLRRMHEQALTLPDILQIKLKALGFKGLVLNPLFKADDTEGIRDILQSVDANVKRDTLIKMIPALVEKRNHIREAQNQIDYKINSLKFTETQIEAKIKQLNEIKVKIDDIFSFLDNASSEAKSFLIEHLGATENSIVLSKRLYYPWQQELKHKDIIKYDYETYTWIVEDIDNLIVATEKKLKNKKSLNCMYFDAKKDPWNSSAKYKNATGINVSLNEILKENEIELKKLSKEKKAIIKSIDDIKSKSAMSYMEAAVLSNQISQKDIETHALLQNSGMKWLYENGNVCCTEFSQGNYRFDVIGYNSDNIITIIEAKASVEDFKRDAKWNNYMKYCNNFYFIFDNDEFYYLKSDLRKAIITSGAGILLVKDSRIILFSECIVRDIQEEVQNLKFNIARICSKKMIYGY